MEKKYFVIIEKEENSCYGVYSPDFKTCFSFGDTFHEAIKNMKEAMDDCLANMDNVPDASSIEDIEKYIIENYPSDSVKTVVELGAKLPVTNNVRINVSIPKDILQQLDQNLAGRKYKRSSYIVNAIMDKLQHA